MSDDERSTPKKWWDAVPSSEKPGLKWLAIFVLGVLILAMGVKIGGSLFGAISQ